MTDPKVVALDYHERTKHHLHRYADSLGYLDWASQPDPFRLFDGAPRVRLDQVEPTDEPTFDAALDARVDPARPLDRHFVSQLFYDSLALSAWKEFAGTRWALRVNPSSGNLHPTEGYLVAGPIPDLGEGPAVWHYAPGEHALEQRRELDSEQWTQLTVGLPDQVVLIGLTSIHWREAWKYGARAFRYCHHDVGHAIGALAVAASVLGWQTRMLEPGDEDLAVLLGVHRQEGIEVEHADCLLALWPRDAVVGPRATRDWTMAPGLRAALRQTPPLGEPNQLSSHHHRWDVIDEVTEATRRETPAPPSYWEPTADRTPGLPRFVAARPIIRQRRSAVAMDRTTTLSREVFLRMLASVRPGGVPFRTLPWRPRIHLSLFVHRVDGLEPGLYCMVRDPAQQRRLAAAMRSDWLWVSAGDDADQVGLFLLAPLDCRDAAKSVCCHQDIAADGVFALGMLADYEQSLTELGPWFYRRLHWEAGALGQVLYLEAEAAGIRSTGIGCFFDDSMHGLLGIGDLSFQTLYHFTVGGEMLDERLSTRPAYEPKSGDGGS